MNNRQRQSRRIQFPAINRAHRHCPRCGRFLLLVNKQPASTSTRRASSLERPSDSKSSKARFYFAKRRGALKMPPEITTFILMTTSYYPSHTAFLGSRRSLLRINRHQQPNHLPPPILFLFATSQGNALNVQLFRSKRVFIVQRVWLC